MNEPDSFDVFAAFEQANQPSSTEIAEHQCPECDQVRRDFCDKRATDLSGEVLERHKESLPLLTPKAWRYFLPAYMSYALQHPKSDVAAILFINLELALEQRCDEVDPYSRSLTIDESRAVSAFLCHYRSEWDDPEDIALREHVAKQYAALHEIAADT